MKVTKAVFLEYMQAIAQANGSGSAHFAYYARYFERYHQGKVIAWNWGAALGGVLWTLFRRMPGVGMCLLLVLGCALWVSPRMLVVALAGESMLLGLFGNYLFLRTVARNLRRGKSPAQGSTLTAMLVFVTVFVLPLLIYVRVHPVDTRYAYYFFARRIGIEKPLEIRKCQRSLSVHKESPL